MSGPKLLIVGECSGRIRQAMRKRGIDARSCDLKSAEDGEQVYHYQGDIFHFLPKTPWMWDLDGLIAHPVCKRLTNAGSLHLYIGRRKVNGIDPEKWADMEAGAEAYLAMKAIPAKRKAIENPIMHKHAAKMIGKRADQFVQPWWFGDPFFKATGWDLDGFPKLKPTNKLVPPKPGTDEHKAWSKVFRMAPGPEREADRSRTEPGHAEAIADQWGGILLAGHGLETEAGMQVMPCTIQEYQPA